MQRLSSATVFPSMATRDHLRRCRLDAGSTIEASVDGSRPPAIGADHPHAVPHVGDAFGWVHFPARERPAAGGAPKRAIGSSELLEGPALFDREAWCSFRISHFDALASCTRARRAQRLLDRRPPPRSAAAAMARATRPASPCQPRCTAMSHAR